MESKEKVYDEQIAPLMAEIISICKNEGVPMFANFQYDDNEFCQTLIYPENVDGRNAVMKLLLALSRCVNEGGVNIDQFFFHVVKNYDNTSSVVMKMMGKNIKYI